MKNGVFHVNVITWRFDTQSEQQNRRLLIAFSGMDGCESSLE